MRDDAILSGLREDIRGLTKQIGQAAESVDQSLQKVTAEVAQASYRLGLVDGFGLGVGFCLLVCLVVRVFR